MKALVGRCNYDLHTYSHRQFWRLVRDLTSCGWTVTIRANEERRPPWKLPEAEDGYECWVQNPGYDDMDVSRCRRGKTAWAALKKAVEEVVGPAESGTANAEAHGRAVARTVQPLVGNSGAVAQGLERRPYKPVVGGSIPPSPTIANAAPHGRDERSVP